MLVELHVPLNLFARSARPVVAQWVTRGLERIVEVMDRQEIDKQKEQAKQQEEEEERTRLEWEETMIQRLGSVVPGNVPSDDGAADTASKLEKLNALFPQDDDDGDDGDDGDEEGSSAVPSAPPSAPASHEHGVPPLPTPVAPPPWGEQEAAPAKGASAAQGSNAQGAARLSPAEPPRYTDLFLDTLRTSTPSLDPEDAATSERPPAAAAPAELGPAPRMPIGVVQRHCARELQSRLDAKHIEIMRLGTYQGRLSATTKHDSTNGCAVISPLVVAEHIRPRHSGKAQQQTSANTAIQYNVSNGAINDIIDKRAPPVLQKVRSKLGLNKHALIIPSDVHDYLVDERILPQDKFVDVCGGDILNEHHIGKLVQMLVDGKGDRKTSGDARRKPHKVGAALFFLEHVISILKVPLGNGACYYDAIDSLPSARAGGMASRTRCKDLASLRAWLRWYASGKFSQAQCEFIDGNAWDEGMCDFDPRVFQGFCWAE